MMSSWGAVQLSKLPRPMRMLFREVVRNSIISFERSIRSALRRITDVSSAPARARFGGGTALRRRCTHRGRACMSSVVRRIVHVVRCTLEYLVLEARCAAPRRQHVHTRMQRAQVHDA